MCETTPSKEPSGKGSCAASAWLKWIQELKGWSRQRSRAAASMSSLMSIPSTRPAEPTRTATSAASCPAPQPTSRIRSPFCTARAPSSQFPRAIRSGRSSADRRRRPCSSLNRSRSVMSGLEAITPGVAIGNLVDRLSNGLPPTADRVADGNDAVGRDLVRDAENQLHRCFVLEVARGQSRAQSEGARRQEGILHSGKNRCRPPGQAFAARHDEYGSFAKVLYEVPRGASYLWFVRVLHEPRGAATVDLAEASFVWIGDHDPAHWLAVSAAWGFGGGLDDAAQICIGHPPIRIEPTHRTGGMNRLEDIHRAYLQAHEPRQHPIWPMVEVRQSRCYRPMRAN